MRKRNVIIIFLLIVVLYQAFSIGNLHTKYKDTVGSYDLWTLAMFHQQLNYILDEYEKGTDQQEIYRLSKVRLIDTDTLFGNSPLLYFMDNYPSKVAKNIADGISETEIAQIQALDNVLYIVLTEIHQGKNIYQSCYQYFSNEDNVKRVEAELEFYLKDN